MENLYKGAGDIKDYEHSLDFLDWVFFTDNSEEPDVRFLSILPKLYKKEYDHCAKNLIVSLNGKWQAAVGLYIEEMNAGGEKLLCGGIGNVAVGKNCRGKGYMKDCMRLAHEKCCEENVDFMILGGQRQRYGYFGFEPAGIEFEYTVNKTNLRHSFGRDYISPLTVEPVAENDGEKLDFIFELYNSSFSSRVVRKREKLFDILVSWTQKPFIIKDNGRNVGYAVFSENKDTVVEIAAVSDDYFRLCLPAVLEASERNSIDIKIHPQSVSYNQILEDLCECMNLGNCEIVNVLNWEHTVAALLKHKASYKKLCGGRQAFLIHGFREDELFTVSVRDNEVCVERGGENPIELSHKSAMQLFLGLHSDLRNKLPPEASQWLPLDFMIFPADMV